MAKLIPAPAGYFLVKAYAGENGTPAFTRETPIVGYRVKDDVAVPVTMDKLEEYYVSIAWAVRVPDGRLFHRGGSVIHESSEKFLTVSVFDEFEELPF